MHQHLQKREKNQLNPWHYKNDLPSMGKWSQQQKTWNESTHGKFSMPERAHMKEKNGEENYANVKAW